MAKQFRIKHGLVVDEGGASITGSLQQSGSDSYFLSNVGIGKDNPFYTLDVEGGVRFQTTAGGGGDGVIQLGVVGNNGYSRFTMGKVNSPTEFQLYNAGDWRLGSSTNSDFSLYTSGSERVRIKNDGNVGIGTTSPSERLHITGSQRIDGNEMYLSLTGSSRKPVRLHHNGYKGAITLQRDGVNNVNISSDEPFQGHTYFNGNGTNVGIGNTSPQYKLDVTGQGRFTDGLILTGSLVLTGSFSAFGAAFTNPVTIYDADATENPRLSVGRSETQSLNFDVEDRIATIFHKQDETSGNQGLRFEVHNDSPTKFFQFGFRDTDGTNHSIPLHISSSGYVGIGTTAPTVPLHVQGDILVNNEVRFINSEMRIIRATDDMRFRTANVDNMVITSAGRVGIGTTSPVNSLTVVTPSNAGKWRVGDYGGMYFANNSDTGYERYIHSRNDGGLSIGRVSGSNLTSGLGGYASTSYDHMYISSSGNVGIGTTTPAYKLDVATNLGVTFGASSYVRINKESLGDIGITAPKIYSGTETLGFQSNNGTTSFNFAYGATSLMTMKSNGNVGIGTTSPSERLHVTGSVKIEGGTLLLNNGDNSVYIGDGTGLNDDKTNNYNVGVGPGALADVTSGAGNIAIGRNALADVTTGGENVAVGAYAAYKITTYTGTTAVGGGSQQNGITGQRNTSLGYRSLHFNETGDDNVVIGYTAQYSASVDDVVMIGYAAGEENVGSHSVGIGYQALQNNTAFYAVGIGKEAAQNNTGTGQPVFIGWRSGINNTGNNNTAVGASSLYSNSGNNISVLGKSTGYNNTGDFLDGVGFSVGFNNNGSHVVGMGYRAVYNNEGAGVVGIGREALSNNSGSYNTALGYLAGYESDTALNNSKNTFLGYKASYGTSGSIINSTAVGAEVTLTDSNTVILGNNAKVGIGTTSPSEKLTVEGNISASGDLYLNGIIQTDEIRSRTYPNYNILNLEDDNVNNTNGVSLLSVSSMVFGLDVNDNSTNDQFEWRADGAAANSGSLLMTLTDEGDLDVSGSGTFNNKLIIDGVESANPTPDTNQVRLSGYGLIGNRSGLYLTNAGGVVQIGVGANHNSNPAATFLANSIALVKNVGINRANTSTPPEALTIEGNISASGDLYLDSGNILIGNTSAAARIDVREDSGYAFRAEDGVGHYFRVQAGGNVEMRGDLTVGGIVTAQEFHTEFVSASIMYDSGSTKFGDDTGDNHSFTGSILLSGSYLQNGAEDNSGKADFAVYTGNYAAVSLRNNQVQIGGIDMNYTGRFEYDNSDVTVKSWDRDIRLMTQASSTNQSIKFHTSNLGTTSEKMRITGAGNVGIGTTSPRAKLDIQDSTHGTLMLSRPSETGYAMISGSSGLGFEFKTYDAGEVMAMKIANDGKVGIGTTSPSSTLDVRPSTTYGGITIKGNVVPRVVFNGSNDSSNYWGIGIHDNQGTQFAIGKNTSGHAAMDDYLVIGSSGNVGIGVTNPTALLDVAAGGGGANTVIMVGNTGNGNIKARHIEGKDHSSTANGPLNLNYYGSDNVSLVYGGGSVGIGTTTPSSKLHVVGDIRTTGQVIFSSHGNVSPINTSDLSINAVGSLQLQTNGGTPQLSIDTTGATRLNQYGSGTFTGTAAYTLAVDSSGNIIEVDTSNINAGENTDVDTGTEVVDTFSSGSGASAFTNYVVNDGTNYRAGQLMTVWNTAGSIEYTDVSTNSIGDTSEVFIFAAINGADIEIKATVPSDNWVVRVNSTLL